MVTFLHLRCDSAKQGADSKSEWAESVLGLYSESPIVLHVQCTICSTHYNSKRLFSCPSSSTNPTLLHCIDFCFFCIDQRFQFSSALLCIGSHSASLCCNWLIQFEVASFSLIIFLQRSYAIDHQF